jgi:hypothetical protein
MAKSTGSSYVNKKKYQIYCRKVKSLDLILQNQETHIESFKKCQEPNVDLQKKIKKILKNN